MARLDLHPGTLKFESIGVVSFLFSALLYHKSWTVRQREKMGNLQIMVNQILVSAIFHPIPKRAGVIR